MFNKMFEEPDENDRDENPVEKSADPAQRAKDKFDEFRMHAELVAVFEGKRKFDVGIYPGLDADVARDIQKTMAKLEKARLPDTPVLPPEQTSEAERILKLHSEFSTGDYHIHRRPGEVMIVRWLSGDLVDTFYERFQAHFDAAMTQFREEERQNLGWKKDPKTTEYLEALDKIDVKMSDRYLREVIQKHKAFILSTQTADEMDILHLCDYVMGVDPAVIVGNLAPGEAPTEKERAWFFKMFALRGTSAGVEEMCFFTYLQKSDDNDW